MSSGWVQGRRMVAPVLHKLFAGDVDGAFLSDSLNSALSGGSGDGIQMFRAARGVAPRRPFIRGPKDLALVTNNHE